MFLCTYVYGDENKDIVLYEYTPSPQLTFPLIVAPVLSE